MFDSPMVNNDKCVTNIDSNKTQLFGKMVVLLLIGAVVILSLSATISLWSELLQTYYWLLIVLINALLVILFIAIFIQILLLPIGIKINATISEITIYYLILKTKFIGLKDISYYTTTNIQTNLRSYKGILIYVNSKEKFLLSDFNLQSYASVLLLMEEKAIPCKGHEKFGIISYYYRRFI